MSSNRSLPLWVQDREEVFKNDDVVEWLNSQRLDYSMTNAHKPKEKKYRYGADFLKA